MAIALAVVVAVLVAAASLRLPSLLSTALAAYVAARRGRSRFATWTLSPLRAVTATGLARRGALHSSPPRAARWWLRGRPGLELGRAAAAAPGARARPDRRRLRGRWQAPPSPTSCCSRSRLPPTNWDSLTYHLARVAAWRQHGGIFWIPNAPTARMNEFQPLAEQEILFLLVATGTTAVFALPQYVAELAILAAVYGASRRLGFGPRGGGVQRGAAGDAQPRRARGDDGAERSRRGVVAGRRRLPAARRRRHARRCSPASRSGSAIGAKLTTVLVLPVIVWLAWTAGRRTLEARASPAACWDSPAAGSGASS